MPNNINIKQIVTLLPGFLHCLILTMWSRAFRTRDNKLAHNHLKRILIVKLDAIGDFIVWLDVAKELRNVYPPDKYVITLLSNNQWADLAKYLSYFDEIWTLDRPTFFTRPAHYIELTKKMCSTSFDVVLHPVYSREFLYGDYFVWASYGKRKIGMRGDRLHLNWWQIWLSERVYTDLVPNSNEYASELEHNASLLRWLGLIDFKAGPPDVAVSFEQPSIKLPADYYVVIAGASVGLRMWPTSRFAALIEKVYTLSGLTAVVCGGEKEELLGRALAGEVSAPLINLTGKTSLPDLFAVISGARFVVGNETGGIHIAVAVGVPSVCITGGGHFRRFIPYEPDLRTQKQLPIPVFRNMECFGCNWDCIFHVIPGKAALCVESVTLESVVSAVMSIIHIKTNLLHLPES